MLLFGCGRDVVAWLNIIVHYAWLTNGCARPGRARRFNQYSPVPRNGSLIAGKDASDLCMLRKRDVAEQTRCIRYIRQWKGIYWVKFTSPGAYARSNIRTCPIWILNLTLLCLTYDVSSYVLGGAWEGRATSLNSCMKAHASWELTLLSKFSHTKFLRVISPYIYHLNWTSWK